MSLKVRQLSIFKVTNHFLKYNSVRCIYKSNIDALAVITIVIASASAQETIVEDMSECANE